MMMKLTLHKQRYLCNGTDGEDGTDGENGQDGADGTTGSGAGEIIPSNIKVVSANEDYTIPSWLCC